MISILSMDSTPTSVTPRSFTVKPSRSTGPVSSTERPLKALKNFSGVKLEVDLSLKFHQVGIPLLVSPTLLRSRNLGQIDLGRITKDRKGWLVEIAEVKSSLVGVVQMQRSQQKRLFGVQQFLAGLFGHRTLLVTMTAKSIAQELEVCAHC